MISCWLSVCPSVCRLSLCPSIHISFLDDNLSKRQWIFAKLGMCIDIVEIWFGVANGQISSIVDRVTACHMIMAGYYCFVFFIFTSSNNFYCINLS